jgi:hypothetical protein
MTALNLWNNSASFTRPADTAVYASGDLVANSTTAGSVVPLAIPVGGFAGFAALRLTRIRLTKSGTSNTNANFTAFFYSSSPTVATAITACSQPVGYRNGTAPPRGAKMPVLQDREMERLSALFAQGTLSNAPEIARLLRVELDGACHGTRRNESLWSYLRLLRLITDPVRPV